MDGGATPLMFAAEQSEIAVLQLLIEKGAAINAVTDDDTTALSIAVRPTQRGSGVAKEGWRKVVFEGLYLQ